MNEDDVTKINKGSRASLALEMITPTLERLEKGILGRMKGFYLSGSGKENQMVACVAELALLDSIKNSLAAEINQAQTISERSGVMNVGDSSH